MLGLHHTRNRTSYSSYWPTVFEGNLHTCSIGTVQHFIGAVANPELRGTFAVSVLSLCLPSLSRAGAGAAMGSFRRRTAETPVFATRFGVTPTIGALIVVFFLGLAKFGGLDVDAAALGFFLVQALVVHRVGGKGNLPRDSPPVLLGEFEGRLLPLLLRRQLACGGARGSRGSLHVGPVGIAAPVGRSWCRRHRPRAWGLAASRRPRHATATGHPRPLLLRRILRK